MGSLLEGAGLIGLFILLANNIIPMSGVSLNEQQFVLKALHKQQRVDGRKLLDHRKVSVILGDSFGVVELFLGETHIISKTTGQIVEPRPEKPN